MSDPLFVAALVLTQSGVPAFGSWYAGKGFLDPSSRVRPTSVAHCSEAAPSVVPGVRVTPYSARERRGLDWPHDWFHVVAIRGGRTHKVTDIEAAYGTCDVFSVDLDNDREPEVIIESGVNRGTSAYVRELEVYRYGGTGYERVFYATLNGYVMTPDGPDGWERSYSFVPVEGALAAVVLRNRLWPATSQQADAQDLDVLQFPVREYCWRTPPGAYRLCRYEYSESGAPPKKELPRRRPAQALEPRR